MERMRKVGGWIAGAGRTCRFLWTVRAAIPWPVKILLVVAMAVKCLPLDFGVDETLTAIAVVILHWMRPGLMRACWRAARNTALLPGPKRDPKAVTAKIGAGPGPPPPRQGKGRQPETWA